MRRLRSAVATPLTQDAASLIATRVDFAQVNAQLAGDLRTATQGRLDADSFCQLLLFGWVPQQRAKIDAGEAAHSVTSAGALRAEQTRLYHVRYKALNRVMAIYWDANQIHEVVLTLQRHSVLHRWHVTKVHQYNVCAYDFDCALVSAQELALLSGGASSPKSSGVASAR